MKAVSLTFVAAAIAAAFPAAAEYAEPLTWTSCGAQTTSSTDVAARTDCAQLVVPVDYAHPEAGKLSLDVVRVIAACERRARHDGALLLEPDEFTGTIKEAVGSMASAWITGDAGWRRVAHQLDVVGLAQRRMADADGHDCLSATSLLPHHAALGADVTDANFSTAEGLARAVATACQNDPMAAHIGVRPRVEDIERLREALGQSQLHILGVGRGGWVAARYAERYPDNVGHLLLDGSWDVDGSVAEAMEARVEERGRAVRRAMSTPGAASAHDASWADYPYGFGPRAAAVTPALVASAFATRCNDGYWGRDPLYWHQRTRELHLAWPSSVGNETFQGMVCSEWPSAFDHTSSVPMLDAVPSFLMVHAEFDNEAPLRNAAMTLNAHDNASMVVARGAHGHAVSMRKDLPCVSAAASRFLADGVLPDGKLTNCKAITPVPAR